MHISIENKDSLFQLIVVSDEGKKLTFDFKELKSNLKYNQDIVFDELNLLWSKLGANRRKQIFEIYEDLEEIVEAIHFDTNVLYRKLSVICERLLVLHPPNELEAFVQDNIKKFPESIPKDNNGSMSEGRTYTWKKYTKLIVISLVTKVVSPVLSFYLKTISYATSDVFKDMVAFKLLQKSWLPKYQGVSDLYMYIEANVNTATIPMSALVGGLGQSDFTQRLLAITMVRRLMLRPLFGEDVNLVIDVYKVARNKSDIAVLNRLFKGKIKAKNPPATSGSKDDDNNSILEDYKIKEVITLGDRVVFTEFVKNVESIYLRVDPDANTEILKECYINLLDRGLIVSIEPWQKQIVQWTLSSVISPRSIETFRKDSLINTMAITQALLWNWGFHNIAILMSCYRDKEAGEYVNPNPVRSGRIPRNKVDRLLELYPHIRNDIKKTDMKSYNIYNEACRSIDTLAKAIGENEWVVHAPQELVEFCDEYIGGGTYTVPPDVRSLLADVVIYLAEMQNN